MCLSIPKCVVEWEGSGEGAGDFAWVERDGQRERINMMLIGPQPVGTWVLTSLGLAKEVIEDEQRQLIEDALAALAASLQGDYDPTQHFRDLGVAHD
ncbi:HypC/HybG/HupF family hydrogenase formation chaperone [Azonexus sp. IMCC34839]|uniref:HypC/HybG/HupF family hydrogenase formation chaperone n=1 Tax=Azonexus sp. IMCC34839 TaxID=3133695 RepID=UPI00399A473F